MKNLFLLLSFLLSQHLSAQSDFGIINDPDGYTNVRSGKGSQNSIIGKIYHGEVFWLSSKEDRKDNWWYIVCDCREGFLEGYMHKSRIIALEEYPQFRKTYQTKDTSIFQDKSLEIIFISKEFDAAKHEIQRSEEGYVAKIDGSIPNGVDGGIPTRELKDVIIETDEGAWHLSHDDIKDIFQPNFAFTNIYRISSGRVFIIMVNGDGGGAYCVIWEISTYDLENRTILRF